MYEICSELTIKTPERLHKPCSSVFIVNFEQILHCSSVFIVDCKQVWTAGWALLTPISIEYQLR